MTVTIEHRSATRCTRMVVAPQRRRAPKFERPTQEFWTAKLAEADELLNAVEDDSTGDTTSPWECLY